jgi:hypothetical protein
MREDETPTLTDEMIDDAAFRAAMRALREEILADPDPRPVIERRILRGSFRPDLTTVAEVFQWHARDRERQARLAMLDRRSGTPGEDEDESVVVADQAAS